MYIVRDIFNLKYGHYREARALMQEAFDKGMIPPAQSHRLLTDFTGTAYRLIAESSHESLEGFEKSMQLELGKSDWQAWYARFKELVNSGHREILKVVG